MPYRQANQKFASAPKAFAAGLDSTPVQFNQRSHQRQAYPQPGLAPLVGSIHLKKHIEHLAEFSRREPNAIVPHADHNGFAITLLRLSSPSNDLGSADRAPSSPPAPA